MLGQYKRDITIVNYHAAWPALFEREAAVLFRALGGSALGERPIRIEHIGSTSIPGMAAKPIIDMMVAVASRAQARELIPVLEDIGYLHRAHDTIPERLFFARERAAEIRTHHLNLAKPDSGFWRDQLSFRDYLRSHDQIAAEYVELKKRLAVEYARTGRLPREGKTAFVARVLELANREESND